MGELEIKLRMRRVEKKPACDPKMAKFIVNTNLNMDKVPECFAGELAQQLSKALGNPAQVSPFAEMFFTFSQLCLSCF